MEKRHEEIQEKIKSLSQAVGATFKRPEKEKVEQFCEALMQYSGGLEYLFKRGISKEAIQHFKLGYDNRRNAISIPIYKDGELVNIKYRLLNNEQRYDSEPNAENWVFNQDGLRWGEKKGAVLIVEGELDCISVWSCGITNVVSPSSGKDSFAPWINFLKKIPKVYIGYDNDVGGKSTSKKIAEILGLERCFEVSYDDCKDANEFIVKYGIEKFRSKLGGALPFVRQDFKSINDVIENLKSNGGFLFESPFIPCVKFKAGWMAVLSGQSNIGKTSVVLNVANQLAKDGKGVLIMPFERGIESVGARYLQIFKNHSELDFKLYDDNDWEKLKRDVSQLPIYFAMPKKEEVADYIKKSKRYFNIDVVIVDHLDYLIRQVGQNRGDAISDTLQQLKASAEEVGVVLLIVSHIRKVNMPGEFLSKSKKPGIEDLKGSSSIYQDPEVVVMLYDNDGEVVSKVLKNKGEMCEASYSFNRSTGVLTPLLQKGGDSIKSLRLNANSDEIDWEGL